MYDDRRHRSITQHPTPDAVPAGGIDPRATEHTLWTGRGRPVRFVGLEVGQVTGPAGEILTVYRTRAGSLIVDRDLGTGWDRDRDVFVVEGNDHEELFRLLGFCAEARGVYARLGIDPTLLVE